MDNFNASKVLSSEHANLVEKADFDSLHKKYSELEARHMALYHLSQLSIDCTHLSGFYAQVHQTISSFMTAKNFFIVLYDQTFSTIEFVYQVDEKDDKIEGTINYNDLDGSFTNLVIESQKPLLVTPQIYKNLQNSNKIKLYGTSGTDWLGVPLFSNGYVIGVMAVQSYSESVRYREQDLELLTFAAQHVVGAMTRLQDNERLKDAVNARTKELMAQIRDREKSELLQESLYRISELTNDASFDIDTFYSKVHNIVGQLINATNFFIAKYNKENKLLNFVYFVDEYSQNLIKDFQPRQLSNHFSEVVIRRGKTVLLDHQQMMDLYEKGETKKPESNMHSWLGVPLIYSGEILGVMVIQSYNKDTKYTEQDAELLNFVSNHVSTAIKRREIADFERRNHELLERQVKIRTMALEDEIKQRKQAEKQLKHTASHDGLTGLPNRLVFIDLLDHAIACFKRKPELSFAILFLDLDRFKMVNDSLGHHAGDLLLKIIAKELKGIVREKDTVARLGGDEFVILIEDLEIDKEAFEIAQRITDILTQPFTIENQQIYTGTSIGILFSDARYDNADTMLRDADIAMYHAKDRGKGRFEVFDASMYQKVQDALILEADIREAIEKEEFEPYFQPIIRLESDKIVGFEALARWQSPKRGFVFPDNFIPLAEETFLVQAIDLQIVKKSCSQLRQWQIKHKRDDLYLSCNLFCNHFFSATLADDLTAILEEAGLEAKYLRVELTERALLENSEMVLTNMQALKQLGVKILLDDFGTGYSSLSYLHRFPIDVLKIDRSFISNIHEHASNRAIIKTIIDLATNLGMTTVGEGIETAEDAHLLQQMECMYGQGYYYAKPLSAEDMEQYILND